MPTPPLPDTFVQQYTRQPSNVAPPGGGISEVNQVLNCKALRGKYPHWFKKPIVELPDDVKKAKEQDKNIRKTFSKRWTCNGMRADPEARDFYTVYMVPPTTNRYAQEIPATQAVVEILEDDDADN
jgi:hypothetical protein